MDDSATINYSKRELDMRFAAILEKCDDILKVATEAAICRDKAVEAYL